MDNGMERYKVIYLFYFILFYFLIYSKYTCIIYSLYKKNIADHTPILSLRERFNKINILTFV